jgi:hypothetical protein
MKRILLSLMMLLFIFCVFAGNKITATIQTRFGPLPVVLVTFNTTVNTDKSVTIRWSTQQELNSDLFNVERSADGINWTDVGYIKAKGNSNQVSDYSFTDLSTLNGISYYRMKVVNLDGDFGYTETRVVHLSVEKNLVIFPNPAKDNLNIYLREASPVQLTLRLISVTGLVLLERKLNGGKGAAVSIPVTQFQPGNYIIQVSGSDGTKQTKEVFIVR